jgi:hypothetical protein
MDIAVTRSGSQFLPTLVLIAHFSKAPTGADAQQPGPGQCAWLDRPVGPDEPSLLRFEGAGQVQWFRVSGPTLVEFHATDGIDRIVKSPGGQQLFTVMAYNAAFQDGRRYFHVTNVLP